MQALAQALALALALAQWMFEPRRLKRTETPLAGPLQPLTYSTVGYIE